MGVVAGIAAGRRTSQRFERGPGRYGLILVGFFVLSCAVLLDDPHGRRCFEHSSGDRRRLTGAPRPIGLAVAVLADRSKGENAPAKLARSSCRRRSRSSALGIIWRFMYQACGWFAEPDRGAQLALGLARRGEHLHGAAGAVAVLLGRHRAALAYLIKRASR